MLMMALMTSFLHADFYLIRKRFLTIPPFIGSGRDKIEEPKQFEDSLKNCTELDLDGLVVIGGDDSNTNACLLAENFAKEYYHFVRLMGRSASHIALECALRT
jgi:6-phosphofructokinase